MRIYLSGAMRADPNYKSKFHNAEAVLAMRYPLANVINPLSVAIWADSARQEGAVIGDAQLLAYDLMALSKATHIIRIADGLPSSGADIELAFAAYACIERLPDLELP